MVSETSVRKAVAAIASLVLAPASAHADPEEDRAAVAALDIQYQAAVKVNDAAVMDRILHPVFALVLGNGIVIGREELLKAARLKTNIFEIQDEEPGTQQVRIWGDTAVVTALLRVKGRSGDKLFDRRLWFSDTYVRTSDGWRYAFAQASLPLPEE
jgi:ketosteroid isomerase-like protein